MIKFQNTAAGIGELQTFLYALDDEALQGEALAIAADFLAWLAMRVELDVTSLEQLRTQPAALRLRVGYCLGACLLARRPFTLQTEDPTIEGRLSFTISLAYDSSGKDEGAMAIAY